MAYVGYAAPCYNMRPEAPPLWELIMTQLQIAQPWPAQPLYLALSFEMVDCSAGYRKTRI
jgi:hypothetical protein